MRIRLVPLAFIAIAFAGFACNSNQSPDQLRQETAKDTATLKKDTQAVAEGIKQGLTENKSVDINKASKDDLRTLPGINDHLADRIIAERPYSDKYQLVSRGALTDKQYEKVQDQIAIGH